METTLEGSEGKVSRQVDKHIRIVPSFYVQVTTMLVSMIYFFSVFTFSFPNLVWGPISHIGDISVFMDYNV
jgi:hypothetical protein